MFAHSEFLLGSSRIIHKIFNYQSENNTGAYFLSKLDDKVTVVNNREMIRKSLQGKTLQLLQQIHSNKVIEVEENAICPLDKLAAPAGDAMVSTKSGVILGVMTADCVPVLFADTNLHVIGAAHAGWQGAIGGIIENTLKELMLRNAKIENIEVLIGPAIQQQSYQVSKDFLHIFLEADKSNMQFFIKDQEAQDKYKFDLPGYIYAKLKKLGIQKVFQIKHDTFLMPDVYPSYRRSTMQGAGYKGSILSTIMVK